MTWKKNQCGLLLEFILVWQISHLCCSWGKHVSCVGIKYEQNEQEESLKGVKQSQQSRTRVREPDVAVARVNILRERQQVASWHREKTIQQKLHSTVKALPSKFLSSLLLQHCFCQTLHHESRVNSRCNFSVFACSC